MKVIHLVPALEQGGVETVVCELSRALVEKGWQSVVISKGGRLAARIDSSGGRHLTLDLKSKNPFTYFQRAFKLRALISKEKPDLVLAHSRVPAWLWVWVNRTLRIPWITYAHGANSVSRYSSVMTFGALTIVPSHFLADYLKKNYSLKEERLRIINPSVDFERFDPHRLDIEFVETKKREWGIKANDFVVMAVGRITPLKGYDTLIKMVKDYKCIIVGDADEDHKEYLDYLKSIAGRNVVFAGGETKIPECLSIANVLISANVRKPESFGLSMAEALAMEVPVVAKAFGGALDVVSDGDDGILVKSEDEFLAAIDKARTTKFIGLRERAMARFNRELMIEKTIAAYREIVK